MTPTKIGRQGEDVYSGKKAAGAHDDLGQARSSALWAWPESNPAEVSDALNESAPQSGCTKETQ